MRSLFYLQSAFTLWMLIDLMRRRLDFYWFWIILFLPPLGPWVYFFMVKIHDYDLTWVSTLFQQPASIEQLRYNLNLNPCLENRIALANGLYEKSEFTEATELYHQALELDNDDREALYGLGLCTLKMGKPAEAVEYFAQVIELDRGFRDYAPWSDMASALWMAGQKEETIEHLESLVDTNSRIDHMTLLAHYLIQLNREEEAISLLRNALDHYANAPRYVKKMYPKSANEAEEMLKSLSDKRHKS